MQKAFNSEPPLRSPGLKGVPVGRPLKRIHVPAGLPPLDFDGLVEFR